MATTLALSEKDKQDIDDRTVAPSQLASFNIGRDVILYACLEFECSELQLKRNNLWAVVLICVCTDSEHFVLKLAAACL